MRKQTCRGMKLSEGYWWGLKSFQEIFSGVRNHSRYLIVILAFIVSLLCSLFALSAFYDYCRQ